MAIEALPSLVNLHPIHCFLAQTTIQLNSFLARGLVRFIAGENSKPPSILELNLVQKKIDRPVDGGNEEGIKSLIESMIPGSRHLAEDDFLSLKPPYVKLIVLIGLDGAITTESGVGESLKRRFLVIGDVVFEIVPVSLNHHPTQEQPPCYMMSATLQALIILSYLNDNLIESIGKVKDFKYARFFSEDFVSVVMSDLDCDNVGLVGIINFIKYALETKPNGEKLRNLSVFTAFVIAMLNRMDQTGWVIPKEYVIGVYKTIQNYFGNVEQDKGKRCDGFDHVVASCEVVEKFLRVSLHSERTLPFIPGIWTNPEGETLMALVRQIMEAADTFKNRGKKNPDDLSGDITSGFIGIYENLFSDNPSIPEVKPPKVEDNLFYDLPAVGGTVFCLSPSGTSTMNTDLLDYQLENNNGKSLPGAVITLYQGHTTLKAIDPANPESLKITIKIQNIINDFFKNFGFPGNILNGGYNSGTRDAPFDAVLNTMTKIVLAKANELIPFFLNMKIPDDLKSSIEAHLNIIANTQNHTNLQPHGEGDDPLTRLRKKHAEAFVKNYFAISQVAISLLAISKYENQPTTEVQKDAAQLKLLQTDAVPSAA